LSVAAGSIRTCVRVVEKRSSERPTPSAAPPTSTIWRSAAGGHHPLAEEGWTTRKNQHGVTEWIPPPHLDYGEPHVNTYHHPEKLLRDDEDDDER
jgi:hypothetical protein